MSRYNTGISNLIGEVEKRPRHKTISHNQIIMPKSAVVIHLFVIRNWSGEDVRNCKHRHAFTKNCSLHRNTIRHAHAQIHSHTHWYKQLHSRPWFLLPQFDLITVKLTKCFYRLSKTYWTIPVINWPPFRRLNWELNAPRRLYWCCYQRSFH